jgi:hypothetical protein
MKGVEMLTQNKMVKTLAASAALVAGFGLGAVLGSPGVAQAQETTTTVVEDSTSATTDTTVATDDSATTEDSATTDDSDGAVRGDHNCDDAASDGDTTATT